MDKATFNFLQKVSYDYKDTLKQIEEIEEEIIYESKDHEVQAGRNSVRNNPDTTANRATALIEDARLTMLNKQVQAVEYALNNIAEIKKEFIEIVYWENPRDSFLKTASEFGVSERTAYRWRREYLSCIGKRMGLL